MIINKGGILYVQKYLSVIYGNTVDGSVDELIDYLNNLKKRYPDYKLILDTDYSYDSSHDINVTGERLATEQEIQEYQSTIKKQEEEQKKRRQENYLKLKKEFE